MRIPHKQRVEGEKIPRGYGFTYYSLETRDTVCHPIPLNFLVAFWRRLHMYLIRGLRDKVGEAYRLGDTKGYNEGHSRGYKEGYRRGCDNCAKEIRAELGIDSERAKQCSK